MSFARSAAETSSGGELSLLCTAPPLGQGGLFLWEKVARQGQGLQADARALWLLLTQLWVCVVTCAGSWLGFNQ